MSRTSGHFARALFKVLALMAAFALVAAACGSDDDDDVATGDGDGPSDTTGDGGDGGGGGLLAQLQESGSITIGIANERPYGFEDENGNATGEAPEVAKAVLAELGITDVDAVVVDFGSLIGGLDAGRFDMIAAGMFINEERAGQILFSDPDYCATTAFAVPAGNPNDITEFQDFVDNPDLTLGVLGGAVEEGYATGSGVPEGQIDPFQTTPDLFDALDAGRIDALALTSITVNEQVADRSGLEATEGFIPVVDGEEQLGCGAYGFRFDDRDFRDAFNEVLAEMKANDEILPIVEEFGFSAADIEAAKGVTAADLAGENADLQRGDAEG